MQNATRRTSLTRSLLVAGSCTAILTAHAQSARLTKAILAGSVAPSSSTQKGPDRAIGAATTFSSTQGKIYALYSLSKPVPGSGRAVWKIMRSNNIKPGTVLLDSKTQRFPNFQFGTFSLDGGGHWPIGQYKVDLYLNSALLKSLSFTVK